ncbi:MAG TPA: DUF1707 domain-containing protein [Arachnia sp.]|nr:DUF1707 domain-containing protein [Arachnia sp.]
MSQLPPSSLPPSSKYRARPGQAVDDTEREALTERLNRAFEEGALTQERYLEAMDIVYAAQTLGELAPVVEALPGPVAATPAIVTSGSTPPGEVVPTRNMVVPALVIGAGIVALALILSVLVLVWIML